MGSTRQSKNRAATQQDPEANQSDRLQLSYGKKALKQLQDNQEADYDKYYKKSFNRDYVIHPSSKSMPAINIMHINVNQFITMKKSELLEFAERKKSHIIAISEVKPKITRKRTEIDYVIPGYFLLFTFCFFRFTFQ